MNKETQLQQEIIHATNKRKMIIPICFVLMWSSGAIFVKLGLQYANPFTFVSLRFSLSTITLWIICFTFRPTYPKHLKEWGYILITGLLLQAGYQIFYFFALDFNISPGILAIILGAQPIITAFFGDSETKYYQWLGLFLGLGGLVLVVTDNVFTPKFTFNGLSSALLCLTCITIGTFMQKRIRVSQPMNMAIQYTGGLVVIVVLLPFFGGWHVLY